MAKWVIDPVALFRAATKLKIKEPVSIKVIRELDHPDSGYYVNKPLHILWIHAIAEEHINSNPSHTIWHELAHAMQCERDFNGDADKMDSYCWEHYVPLYSLAGNPKLNNRFVKQGTDRYQQWLDQYMAIPIEAEAEDIACLYADKYPLAKIKV